jgi:hypothetical protein
MLPLHMPLSAITAERRGRFDNSSPLTRSLTRGVCRMLTEIGYGPLTEFRLPNRRRCDVIGLGSGNDFIIVEVKSSVADFRGDAKWPEYVPYCDQFYFAVPESFPAHILPEECGFMVADSYGAAIRREAPEQPLATLRRRRQLLRFALTASERLNRLSDPRS